MRIVIDMQGLQATNGKRGIGRYTSDLVKRMLELKEQHEVILLLNGLLLDSIDSIRREFSRYLPIENILVWSAIGPVSAIDKSNDARRDISEKIREDFITKLSPDILLVTSLFEGLPDDAVTSIGNLNTKVPTAVILYDLIPLIHKDIYLKDDVVEQWYLDKIDHLRRADLLLSISNSSRGEAVRYLGFNESNVVNISTACDEGFKRITQTENERLSLVNKYNLDTPYIMYTGGIDYRKNIEGLLKAYSLLPASLRSKHQLAIVCSIQDIERDRLAQLCKSFGLKKQDVIFTGYVPEADLIGLYNNCYCFVFPSWHEGFGLPVLEAMCCGKAVIGGNLSSIPEVIGCEEALFDPYDNQQIAAKLERLLVDEDFKASLEKHAESQSLIFSWDISAKLAWDALEKFHAKNLTRKLPCPPFVSANRKRLAYVSPLPPAKSGIADYSAELISELSRHYSIDVIVDQDDAVSEPYIIANCNIRSVQYFEGHSAQYDRILYHFGNSAFHGHMFQLLNDYPGVVVLHDFFISGVVAHIDVATSQYPGVWSQELHKSGGWPAVYMRYHAKDTADVVYKYPCNISVLQNSMGVIVHSDFSRRLASKLYGHTIASDWALIPHLRVPVYDIPRKLARKKLGISENAFLVCSFGLLGPTKLNHKLLSAWINSPLSEHEECHLVFVGENHSGTYGSDLQQLIKKSKCGKRIKITGWAEVESYKMWLAAADVGVQLRTLSRGETSGTVLDCMNYGLATIVNANGSMADLDEFSVVKLADEFLESELVDALTSLYNDENYREKLKAAAISKIRTAHHPRTCAEEYKTAIESFYGESHHSAQKLIGRIVRDAEHDISAEYLRLSTAIAKNYEPEPRKKQLFVDVSELVQRDAQSGIQRVVRAVLNQLLHNPPEGWIVEPIYATEMSTGYRYARKFTCQFLDIPSDWTDDSPIEAWQGDVFLGLDLQPNIVQSKQDFLKEMHRRGVKVHFVVYDLLPILAPESFFPGAKGTYESWLSCITQFDGAICISQTVANELANWVSTAYPNRVDYFDIQWFHLGADLVNSVPSNGEFVDSANVLEKMASRPTFLMVSTIEPRKQHTQVLDAFEILWKNGKNINLVIVGKQGWMVEQLIERLSTHKELNNRLFWLSGVSDEYLERVYRAANCLILASSGEGFGLPLIEAAQYNVPIIARDIPVFREVAGDSAFYFNGMSAGSLATAIDEWCKLESIAGVPDVTSLKWLTWEQSAKQLLNVFLK
jgi:glycosyltransferase involved in cell wall biosynthesis